MNHGNAERGAGGNTSEPPLTLMDAMSKYCCCSKRLDRSARSADILPVHLRDDLERFAINRPLIADSGGSMACFASRTLVSSCIDSVEKFSDPEFFSPI